MKTYLHFLIFTLFTGLSYGQVSFSDDFEDYNVGDGIAETSDDWILWPAPAATDAFVTDENAAGGNNSIRLPGGQEVDVILPFGDIYTEGTFNFSMDIFIPEGRNSYFNFQGNNDPGGPTGLWVLQCYLRNTGIFTVDNGETTFIQNAYPFDEWFNITLDINLSENLWRIFINGECLGSFQNTDERIMIAGLDLYPDDGNAMAFVDNVKFSHTDEFEPVDIQTDATYLGGVDVEAGIGIGQGTFYGFNNSSQSLDMRVGNAGNTDIESFSVTMVVDGQSTTQDFMQSIPAGSSADVSLDQTVPYSNGDKIVSVSINNVNGDSDDNTCNNTAPMLFRGFTPAADKKVWVEEATGTWCTWCPRGAVYMDYMTAKYPELFVGIAVHAGDPMEIFEWAGQTDNPNTPENEGANFGTLIGGYPSSSIDRTPELDPAAMEAPFVTSVQVAPLVTLDHGAEFNEDTRELKVNVETNFTLVALANGTKLVVGLTEDGVTGPGDGVAGQTTDFDQINAYSGGGRGPMGGYENLPNPVPATDMVYEHVARVLLTDWEGLQDAYIDTPDKRENHTFSVTIPDDWNIDNMHIVSAFVKADGTVENANSSSIANAIANGYTSTINVYLDSGIDVYPNPTNGIANISLNFDTPTEISLEVNDAMGKVISKQDYGTLSGQNNYQFDGSNLNPGVYYLRFNSGNEFTSKRLIITK